MRRTNGGFNNGPRGEPCWFRVRTSRIGDNDSDYSKGDNDDTKREDPSKSPFSAFGFSIRAAWSGGISGRYHSLSFANPDIPEKVDRQRDDWRLISYVYIS